VVVLFIGEILGMWVVQLIEEILECTSLVDRGGIGNVGCLVDRGDIGNVVISLIEEILVMWVVQLIEEILGISPVYRGGIGNVVV